MATADLQVGRLIDYLASAGRLDRTIVVVLGDHGESLGEHDEEQHAFFVYDATVRIPVRLTADGLLLETRLVDLPTRGRAELPFDVPSGAKSVGVALEGRS